MRQCIKYTDSMVLTACKLRVVSSDRDESPVSRTMEVLLFSEPSVERRHGPFLVRIESGQSKKT
jgi:hypothetical protein